MQKIIIGSDKSGFSLKEAVKAHLLERGVEVEDCGTRSLEAGIPYFEVAPVVAERVQSGEFSRGIVGATSNPIIVGAVVKKELPYWEPRIRRLIAENPSATEDEITWLLLYEVGRERSKKLLPVFEKFKGRKGRLSIQVNAKYYRSRDKMVEQAVMLNTLGRNMQVKLPASAAGVEAMEEATYRGVSINATVSFTVAQAVAVAEAVERGLARRKAEGLPCDEMAPVCTIMIGRTDDWMKAATAAEGVTVIPEALEWAGVAVI